MRPAPTSPAELDPHPARSDTGTRRAVDHVIVAVPARNEAESIVDCLLSIDRAAERCAPTPVTVVGGADSCTDGTARARRAAVATARRSVPGDTSAVWVANTDADCRVPVDWLTTHLELATHGCAVVGGIVALDPDLTPGDVLHDFGRSYVTSGDRHAHLHAANLGIRLDVYDAAGGWHARVELGEEHELAQRLAALGIEALRTTASSVVTSHRHTGRVSHGFAAFMQLLGSSRGGGDDAPIAGRHTIRFVA